MAAIIMLALTIVSDGPAQRGRPLPPSLLPPSPPPIVVHALPPVAAPVPVPVPGGSPPAPANDPATWITPDDWAGIDPVEAAQGGIVRVRLSVSDTGAVRGCAVLAGVAPAIDRATCRLIAARARFHPARNGAGAAVPGHHDHRVRWRAPLMPAPLAPAPVTPAPVTPAS